MKWCLQSFIREPRSVMGSEGWMKKVTTLEWYVYRILWRFVLFVMLYRLLKWRYTSLKRVVNITVVAIEGYSRRTDGDSKFSSFNKYKLRFISIFTQKYPEMILYRALFLFLSIIVIFVLFFFIIFA